MRLRGAILLTTAVLISSYPSVATDAKPIQAGDASSRRLRSDTQADENGEERFIAQLKNLFRSSVKIPPKLPKTGLVKPTNNAAKMAFNQLDNQFKNLPNLSLNKLLESDGYKAWDSALTKYNAAFTHDATNPAHFLRSKYTDDVIVSHLAAARKGTDDAGLNNANSLEKGLSKEWVKLKKPFKDVNNMGASKVLVNAYKREVAMALERVKKAILKDPKKKRLVKERSKLEGIGVDFDTIV